MQAMTAPPAWQALRERAAHWSPTTRGLIWTSAAGFTFGLLNATMRLLTQQLDPFQAQFLRYFFGLLVLLPLIAHRGLASARPKRVMPHFTRGAFHTVGLAMWFSALPHIPLADTTAIGFTGPIFIMIGAYLFLGEAMRWERWVATLLGFVGVLIVLWPRLSGSGGGWHLMMLASAPVFAASFLLTKAMTREETAGVILVWQSISVSILSLPMAIWVWQPMTGWQWLGFLGCGVLGSLGHYCLTRSYVVADISATQSAKFLDLLWAAFWGWMLFADLPSKTTLAGGVLICAATIWVARREAIGRRAAATG